MYIRTYVCKCACIRYLWPRVRPLHRCTSIRVCRGQSMQYLRRQQHCRYHQRNPFVDTLSLLRHVARCCPFPVCPPWSLGRHRVLKILPSARFIVIVAYRIIVLEFIIQFVFIFAFPLTFFNIIIMFCYCFDFVFAREAKQKKQTKIPKINAMTRRNYFDGNICCPGFTSEFSILFRFFRLCF